MSLLHFLKQEEQIEKNLLSRCRDYLKKLPLGSLRLHHQNGTSHYIAVSESGERHYINKSNSQLITDLQERKLIETVIKNLGENLTIIASLKRKCKLYDFEDVAKTLHGAYANINLEALYARLFEESPWIPKYFSQHYDQSLRRFETSFGLLVRSKSELLIAELLHQNKIKFRYEESILLRINDNQFREFYPDFTIYLQDGQTIYWEHMGLMSNLDYRNSAFHKLTTYFFNDIYMGKNLIITMDSPDGTIDMKTIKKVVKALAVYAVKEE